MDAKRLITAVCYLCETIIRPESSVTDRAGWIIHAKCDREFPLDSMHTRKAPYPSQFPKYVLDQDSPLPTENRRVESVGGGYQELEKVQKPSQGRIVLYQHPGSLDGKFPPRTSPAIIQDVIDASAFRCRVFVFGPLGQHQDVVDYGTGPSQWSWPPRV